MVTALGAVCALQVGGNTLLKAKDPSGVMGNYIVEKDHKV
jgi:hypothetical protein